MRHDYNIIYFIYGTYMYKKGGQNNRNILQYNTAGVNTFLVKLWLAGIFEIEWIKRLT